MEGAPRPPAPGPGGYDWSQLLGSALDPSAFPTQPEAAHFCPEQFPCSEPLSLYQDVQETLQLSRGLSLGAGAAAGTCKPSLRDAGRARDIGSGLQPWWLLSCPRWQAPPAAQAEAGNPGQLPWEPACLLSPLLSSARLCSSPRGPPRRAEPALRVCACVGGGAAAWI